MFNITRASCAYNVDSLVMALLRPFSVLTPSIAGPGKAGAPSRMNCFRSIVLTLCTSNYFCQTPVGARLSFSMLLLGAELIFANLPPGAGLFF